MPDFIDEVQSLYSDDQVKPEEKFVLADPTNLYIKSNEIQEYSEQYLKEFYSQLNKTSNREIRIPASTILNPSRNILLIVGGPRFRQVFFAKVSYLTTTKRKNGYLSQRLLTCMDAIFIYGEGIGDSDIKSMSSGLASRK